MTDQARTNAIALSMPIETVAEKLLVHARESGLAWQLDHLTLPAKVRKSPAALLNEHKKVLARTCPEVMRTVLCRGKRDPSRYYFLKKAATTATQSSEDKQVDEPEVIVRLILTALLLEEARLGSKKSGVGLIGSDLFLKVRVKKEYIDALKLDLQFFKGKLIVNLKARAFKKKTDEPGVETGLMFPPDSEDPSLVSIMDPDCLYKADGRKTNYHDISFVKKEVQASKCFILNRIIESFSRFLQDAGVACENVNFSADTYIHPKWVTQLALDNHHARLVVLNASDMPLTQKNKALIESNLSHEISVGEFIHIDDAASDAVEKVVQRYGKYTPVFCLIRDVDPVVQGVAVRAIDAYVALDEGRVTPEEVDLYTRAKHALVWRRSDAVQPIIQGLRWNEMFVHMDGKAAQIRKCATEIALKGSVARLSFTLPEKGKAIDGTFTLIRRQAFKADVGQSRRFTETISLLTRLKIRIEEGVVTVLERDFIKNPDDVTMDAWATRYPFIRNTHYSFYLVDEARKKVMKVSAGEHIPKLILNAKYATIDEALAVSPETQAVLPRTRSLNLVPFVVHAGADIKKWREAVYIQRHPEFMRLVIPSWKAAEVNVDFPIVRDVLIEVYGGQESIEKEQVCPEEDPLFHLYLNTLTRNVLRLGNQSATSLLEKVTSLVGAEV